MNILTDEEIKATLDKVSCCLEDRDIAYSRAIEAAVLSNLAEQDVEPVGYMDDQGVLWESVDGNQLPSDIPLYTETQLLAAQQRTAEACESLRQQLAEKDAEIAQLHLARDMLYSEGCEKDAEIARLNADIVDFLRTEDSRQQSVCESIAAFVESPLGQKLASLGEGHRQVAEAIRQKFTDYNLEAMIAKAGEVMRERAMCAYSPDYLANDWMYAIRALPGVTLEDLK